MGTTSIRPRKLDILYAVERICELARGSKMSSDFFKSARSYTDYLSKRLSITREQSVMLALFVDRGHKWRIYISEFAEYLDCSQTRILRYWNDVDELVRLRFLFRQKTSEETCYTVNPDALLALRNNEVPQPRDYSGMTVTELFSELEILFKKRCDNWISFGELTTYVHEMFEANTSLVFVQKVKSLKLTVESEMLLVMFAHLFVNNYDDHIGFHDLRDLYSSNSTWNSVRTDLYNGSHCLLKGKLIEYNIDNGFINRESMKLTREMKTEFLQELNIPLRDESRPQTGERLCDDIEVKELVFGDDFARQVDNLCSLLTTEHYSQVRDRLKASGHRLGFACLFYGPPGTGKTETALQLARKTGRNIIQVDVSNIKSKWVGESEKNLKNIFDTYRKRATGNPQAPILLFNEADAIIGIRNEGAEQAVEKMENSLQNILLQEMENLDGIIIATTNLVQNLDRAFERRFLFKLKFEKPGTLQRAQMWKLMIPQLGNADCELLAQKFDFSGGEIENIARHFIINRILHGEDNNTLNLLIEQCHNERINANNEFKVGY